MIIVMFLGAVVQGKQSIHLMKPGLIFHPMTSAPLSNGDRIYGEGKPRWCPLLERTKQAILLEAKAEIRLWSFLGNELFAHIRPTHYSQVLPVLSLSAVPFLPPPSPSLSSSVLCIPSTFCRSLLTTLQRDLKSPNILVSKNYTIKIGDLGKQKHWFRKTSCILEAGARVTAALEYWSSASYSLSTCNVSFCCCCLFFFGVVAVDIFLIFLHACLSVDIILLSVLVFIVRVEIHNRKLIRTCKVTGWNKNHDNCWDSYLECTWSLAAFKIQRKSRRLFLWHRVHILSMCAFLMVQCLPSTLLCLHV